jgi:hypothetical protein
MGAGGAAAAAAAAALAPFLALADLLALAPELFAPLPLVPSALVAVVPAPAVLGLEVLVPAVLASVPAAVDFFFRAAWGCWVALVSVGLVAAEPGIGVDPGGGGGASVAGLGCAWVALGSAGADGGA